MKNYTRGFTLVELLIVIALLGALAVGLLAALDPFEQLKKGTDTGTRNLVSEVQGAIIRYYGIKNNFPWCPDGGSPGTGTCVAGPTWTDLATEPMKTAIDNIIAAGELKSDFISLAGGNVSKIFVVEQNPGSKVVVCYKPTAKSFIADPNTKYDNTGTENPACATAGGCYWCVK